MVPISQSSQVPSKISVDFAVILMFKYVPAIFTSVFTARMLMQLKPGPQLCQSTGYIDCKMKPRRLRSDVVSQSGKLKGRHARAGAFLKRIETYYHNP